MTFEDDMTLFLDALATAHRGHPMTAKDVEQRINEWLAKRHVSVTNARALVDAGPFRAVVSSLQVAVEVKCHDGTFDIRFKKRAP